jgi:hypothetical protein
MLPVPNEGWLLSCYHGLPCVLAPIRNTLSYYYTNIRKLLPIMPNYPKWPNSYLLLIVLALSGSTVLAAVADQFTDCKRDIERIWNENVTLRGFNREKLKPFFYTGNVERFDGTVPRFSPGDNITDGMYFAFTYEGKVKSRTI